MNDIKDPKTALVGSIQKFSTEDGPGIRTTVFFKGCPLECLWCHNPELIDFRQQIIRMPASCIGCGYCIENCPEKAIYIDEEKKVDIDRDLCSGCMECVDICYADAIRPVAKAMTIDEILYEVEQDKTFYDNTGGGMTLSGGEMLSHFEFVDLLIDRAGERDIKVCLDTSGYGDGDHLEKLARKSNVERILYDMKAIDDEVHRKCTGHSNEIILENLIRLSDVPELSKKIQMRMPLVSGVNDNREMLERTADFYRKNGIKRVTLLPYHDLGISKQRNIGKEQKAFSPPSDGYVEEIKKLFQERGDMEVDILGKL